jgi:hypothetical protein
MERPWNGGSSLSDEFLFLLMVKEFLGESPS